MKVIDFALKLEHVEQDFFRDLARTSDREELRGLFSRIAEEEGESLKKLEKIKAQGLENEESPRLGSLLARIKVALKAERILQAKDEVDVYRQLMETEKGVCRLVRQASEDERDEKTSWRLAQVAGKECRQSEALENLLDFVNAPNEFLAWSEFSNLDEFHNFGRYAGTGRILPDGEILH